jgi:hypothetical protein
MKNIYEFRNKLVTMTTEQFLAEVKTLEESSRSGKFKYTNIPLFSEQIAEIKTWPAKYVDNIRSIAKRLSGGDALKNEMLWSALVQTLKEVIAVERSTNLNTRLDTEIRYLMAELSLATLFKRAPENGNGLIRKYSDKGRTFRIKASSAPRRVVVNPAEVDSAEVFVFAYYAQTLPHAMLLGWATRDQVKAMPLANRQTDPKYNWDDMLHLSNISALNPMSKIMGALNATEFVAGTIFETPPAEGALPFMGAKQLQDGLRTVKAENFDFRAACGLS